MHPYPPYARLCVGNVADIYAINQDDGRAMAELDGAHRRPPLHHTAPHPTPPHPKHPA